MQPEDLKRLLTTKAIEVCTPPFRYECGYIFDANGKMVADEGSPTDAACRVRGWGRLQYLNDVDPAQLQDRIGEMIAEGLTAYWKTLKSEGAPPRQTEFDLFCLRHQRRDETVYWDGAGGWVVDTKDAALFTSWEAADKVASHLSKTTGVHSTPIITQWEATK